ncbi:MAG: hypothetical protein Q8Q49_04470 [bacterium]|nr:hypothetical protein [bacterium]
MTANELDVSGNGEQRERTLASKPRGISILQINQAFIDSTGVATTSDRRPELIKDGIDWDYQSNTFYDSSSRYPGGQPHEKQMSGFELRRLQQNYPAMLTLIRAVRDDLISSSQGKGSEATKRILTADEMGEVLHALMYLPHYLAHRAQTPIPPMYVLPPAVIILSNASSGANGALEGYLDTYEYSEGKVPDVEKMIADAESRGSMVGEKTVCVASPDRMKHFMHAVIEGPKQNEGRFDLSAILGKEEILLLRMFAEDAYYAHNNISAFKGYDLAKSETLKKHIKNKHNPRHFRTEITDFLAESKSIIFDLNLKQVRVNFALGRQQDATPLTLDSFEAIGFHMPGLLRRIGRR